MEGMEVVNPHSRSMSTKIQTIVVSKRLVVLAHRSQPQWLRGSLCEPVSTDEVGTFIIREGQARTPYTVLLSGRLRQARKKNHVTVCCTLQILKGIVIPASTNQQNLVQ